MLASLFLSHLILCCMHFLKTDTGMSIVQVVAIAEEVGYRIYVAWEMTGDGGYGFAKSRQVYSQVNNAAIKEAADLGNNMEGREEKIIFANLLKNRG